MHTYTQYGEGIVPLELAAGPLTTLSSGMVSALRPGGCCIHTYVCVHICMYILVDTHCHAHMCVIITHMYDNGVCMLTYVCIHTCVTALRPVGCMYVCMHTCTYTRVYHNGGCSAPRLEYVCIHQPMYVCIHTCTNAYMTMAIASRWGYVCMQRYTYSHVSR